MVIPAPETHEEELTRHSRQYLDLVVAMVEGLTYYNKKQDTVALGRFYNWTLGAADPASWGPDWLPMYEKVLGADGARQFLSEFNAAVEHYANDLKAGKTDARLTFETEPKVRVLAALRKLKEATKGYDGFFIPQPGMHARRNIHLCTGR